MFSFAALLNDVELFLQRAFLGWVLAAAFLGG